VKQRANDYLRSHSIKIPNLNKTEISCSRAQPVRSVERAKIMLASYEGKNDSQIARELSTKEEITDKEL